MEPFHPRIKHNIRQGPKAASSSFFLLSFSLSPAFCFLPSFLLPFSRLLFFVFFSLCTRYSPLFPPPPPFLLDMEDLIDTNFMDVQFLPPNIPHQVGPTCAYHAITTVVESRFRALFLSIHGHCENMPSLSVQYLYDFSPVINKHSTFHYTENVGIAVHDYAVGGMRGEHQWVPSAILRHPHYRVERWIELQPIQIEKVEWAMRDGAVYADYCAPQSVMEDSTQLPIEATIVRSEEEFRGLKLCAHSVVIIGTGTVISSNRPYYIFRNSYGPTFGDNGYGRIFADTVASIFVPVLGTEATYLYEDDPRNSERFSRESSSLGGHSGAGPSTAGPIAGPSWCMPSRYTPFCRRL